MIIRDVFTEKKSKRKKGALYGPGPYGWYGTDSGYSGDGGGGVAENKPVTEFAPNPGDEGDDPRFNPETFYDIPKLKSVARRLAQRSVNFGWYDLQLTILIKYMSEPYIVTLEDLDDMFPTAPEIVYYIERNIIKAWPSNDPPYIIKNPNYKPRPPRPVAGMGENFADGKNPGRKGLAKRSGVDCKQPVSKLRSIAASSSGERQRMAHWCANMKSGKKKSNEDMLNENNDQTNSVYLAIKDLLPVAMKELALDHLPKIKIVRKLDHSGQPTFGTFSDKGITLAVDGRHPIDICRTLAHELVHYKQKLDDQLNADSGKTGSPEENEANSVAGVIMRNFSKQHPEHMSV